jgi:hypothetical protein
MKRKGFVTRIALLTLVLVACFVRIASVSADDGRNGQLHIQKDCTKYAGNAGDHCTVTLSNFEKIPTGSHIFYDQAAGVPAGMLDSNINLDAGGVTEMGRTLISRPVRPSLSDGTGTLAGSLPVSMSRVCGPTCANGTYSFNPLPPR